MEKSQPLFKGDYYTYKRYMILNLLFIIYIPLLPVIFLFNSLVGSITIILVISVVIFVLKKYTKGKHYFEFYEHYFIEHNYDKHIQKSYTELLSLKYKNPSKEISRIILTTKKDRIIFTIDSNGDEAICVYNLFKLIKKNHGSIKIKSVDFMNSINKKHRKEMKKQPLCREAATTF